MLSAGYCPSGMAVSAQLQLQTALNSNAVRGGVGSSIELQCSAVAASMLPCFQAEVEFVSLH